ncbi:hypothetical protein RDABS01_018724 [Bienertia sinuspersici]
MVSNSMYPDESAYPFVLRSCKHVLDVNYGRRVHGHLVKLGFDMNDHVSAALGELYERLGEFENTREVLDEMPLTGLDYWNFLILESLQNDNAIESFGLFKQMMEEGIWPNSVSLINLLRASTKMNSLKLGELVHGLIVVNGFSEDLSVSTALLTMYSKLGNLKGASLVFETMTDKDRVMWNLMISAYTRWGHPRKSMELLVIMCYKGIRIDLYTALAAIPAVGELRSLEQGKQIHAHAIRNGLNCQTSVQNCLIDMYCRCDSVEAAKRVFNSLIEKTEILWSSMIKGYVNHDRYFDALCLFAKMKYDGCFVDSAAVVGVLPACVNAGALEHVKYIHGCTIKYGLHLIASVNTETSSQVKEGWQIFKEMTETYGFQPSQEHYACMVDLLGKAGHISKAQELINTMPIEADARVWGPLLSACKMHSDTAGAELAADRLMAIEPTNPGNYILLSNIYAASGKWDKVAKMRSFLKDKNLKKTPGCSWLEVSGKKHEFRVADRSHPKSNEIYSILQYIELEIEDTLKARDDTLIESSSSLMGGLSFWVTEHLAKDLELFAHHAVRKLVNTEDVKLAAHRNENLSLSLRAFCNDLKAKEPQSARKRKKASRKEDKGTNVLRS